MSKPVASLRDLERSLAYTFACSVVEGNCAPVGGDDLSGWYDICDVNPHAAGDLADALLYLQLSGLLERDLYNLNHVAIRDQDEAHSLAAPDSAQPDNATQPHP